MVVANFLLYISTKWKKHQQTSKRAKLDKDKITNDIEIKTFKRKVTTEYTKHEQTQMDDKTATTSTWSKIIDSSIKVAECQEAIKNDRNKKDYVTRPH